ncbi:hypothetical protein SGRIM128S_07540 [Streptomyces griseomycini]
MLGRQGPQALGLAPQAPSSPADNTHGTGPPDRLGGLLRSLRPGACSMMAWAFVPLKPNDDTPARHGRSATGHSRSSVSNSTAPADQSTCGDGSSACSVRGSTPCRIAITILITPATPAAACVCPMLDFTEPSSSGRSTGRS